MASQFIPIRAAAFTFEVPGLFSQADPTIFQVAPTIAAGDFWISKDGGGWFALTNAPTAVTLGSVDTMVQFVLTSTEMTADRVAIKWVDAAGAEWIAGSTTFYTAARGIDATDADVAAILVDTAVIGAAGAGLTALGDTRIANLDAAVSSRSTYAGGAVASVTGAVGSVAGNVDGNVTGSVGSLATQAKADVNAEADTALTDYAAAKNTDTLLANVKKVNDAALTGTGSVSDPWGPA